MLYSCRCGTTINIAASHFVYIHDSELERLCLYEGSVSALNPWMESALDEEGDIEQKTYRTKAPIRDIQGCSLDDMDDYIDDDETDDDVMDIPKEFNEWEE